MDTNKTTGVAIRRASTFRHRGRYTPYMIRRLQATIREKSGAAPRARTEWMRPQQQEITRALTSGIYAHYNEDMLWRLKKLVSPGNPQDKYIKQKEIGDGRSGKVHKGIEVDGGKEVAIKIMRLVCEKEGDPFIPEFHHEIQNMKNISSETMNHKNIIRYLDSYLVDTELWLVMEFIDGIELREAAAYTLQTQEIAVIFHSILTAVEYIHTNQIIHTDLKSENILMSKRGDVKIAGFGLSRKAQNYLVNYGHSDTTPYIMDPELAHPRCYYNNKVDIWALGITLYQVLYGRAPHEREHAEMIKNCILANCKPSIPDEDKLDPDVADFLDQCLTVNHTKRSSATELLGHRLFQNNQVHSKSQVANLVDKVIYGRE
jgi:serine/threonine protein kinase